MWKEIFMSAIFLAGVVLSAQEVLSNADFKIKGDDGKLKFWECRGNAKVYEENGILVFEPASAKEKTMVIQKFLPLKNGRKYQLAFEVKGGGSEKNLVYVEFRDKEQKLRGFYTSSQATPGNWTNKKSGVLLYPEGASGAYLVILPGKTAEKTYFRNITLKEIL